MKKLLLLLVALSAPFCQATAQSNEHPFALGVHTGLTQYNGDLGQGFYDFGQAGYSHLGLSANWYINPRFDFVTAASVGNIGYISSEGARFRASHMQANLHFRMNLLTADKYKLLPFLHAGIGVSDISKYSARPGTDVYVPFGYGVRYLLNDLITLSLQETYGYTDNDEHDWSVKRTNDAFLMHTIGISINLGRVKDADNDGVVDRMDACPGTMKGMSVDERGCPFDKDQDGTPDVLDKCPDVKGTVATKGCPDRDEDGIADADDRCPVVKGIASLEGCPDTDGDGITDGEDACPNEKGMALLKGCPDKDGDGISDIEDQCIDRAGPASNYGCPIVDKEPKIVRVDISIPVVYFANGRSDIPAAYIPVVESVVKKMKDNPNLNCDIVGHTDANGNMAANEALSQKRALVARDYLLSKGIAKERINLEGRSSQQPAANNKSSIGRAQNRRVEFILK